ncbi:ATP-grasp domain-containing protein [Marivirga sp.]|uniref:ATP-grasp domain-containing protein n=1 Tax=Marivirga sp. TaxID=2018662 RepID=UPI0025F1940A|nr:ATP-grasp domain-containing protein [Marivirga sp.]
MKKIAILGASYLQKPLVEKAIQLGLETYCFAWDSDDAICKNIAHHFYPISVLDKELILEKCKDIKVDGITTIATDICVPTICYVAEKMGLISNSFRSGIISTNKAKMRSAFLTNDVNSPKSIALKKFNFEHLKDLRFPMIVKPTDRSGSRGVVKVSDINELKSGINQALEQSFEKQVVIEEFIEGIEVSVETISWRGEHYILAITDKITTGNPYFVELEHHQPSQLTEYLKEKIRIETLKALDALEITYGASHAEFKILDNGKVVTIEVGGRMGGDFIGSHLVKLSTGYDFLKGVIKVALNEFEKPQINNISFSGVYFLSKETEYLLPYFNRKNIFDAEKNLQNNKLNLIRNSNDRSGYIIYQSQHKLNLI